MATSCRTPAASIARRWRAVLLLCGWFAATGVHWDVVQVAAWGKMWIDNSRTHSSADALAITFSVEGMCSVCHAVQAAKQVQRDDDVALTKLTEKAPLLLASAVRSVIAAPGVSHRIALDAALEPPGPKLRPPVPPPRSAAIA